MSYPTANLIGQYEPWRWAYADNTTYNGSTAQVLDFSGNSHACTTIVGSPKHRTGLLHGMPGMRFDGSSAVTCDSFANTDPVTICALVIPRALGGASYYSFCGFNNGTTTAVPQMGYHGTNNHAFAWNGTNLWDGTTVLVVGTSYVITGIFSGTQTCRIRVASAEENNVSASAMASVAKFSLGAGIGANLTNPVQWDVLACFIYNQYMHGTQALTDLEAYVTTLQSSGAPTVNYTDTLLPGSYSLSGQAVAQGYHESVMPGSYVLSGQSVTEQSGGGLLGGHGAGQWFPHGGRR